MKQAVKDAVRQVVRDFVEEAVGDRERGNETMTRIIGIVGVVAIVLLISTLSHRPVSRGKCRFRDRFRISKNECPRIFSCARESNRASAAQEPRRRRRRFRITNMNWRAAIREARKNARPGDIFTPEIAGEIRRLITIAMQQGDGDHIGQSLRHAEPVQLHLASTIPIRQHIPLQSTPPSLLENLPKLPPEIEYRITGRDLVLLDAKANLVVDLIRGVFS